MRGPIRQEVQVTGDELCGARHLHAVVAARKNRDGHVGVAGGTQRVTDNFGAVVRRQEHVQCAKDGQERAADCG